ncbi:MAG: tetratricopeptide repeat protein [Planctomycetota bacterium]|jgi:tetratricopeptide (TPR) repeat protein
MDGFEGVAGMQSFWPGWSRPEVLEKTLAGRKELVDRLEELAIDGAGGPNKHQRLIVGVRGSGKTHVLRVLHNRLWANEDVKERLLIVYMLEDELGVASFLDFVVRMLRAIVRGYPEQKELAEGLEAIYDLPSGSQESRAVQLLLGAAGPKDVLIIMENLGVTFDDVKGFRKEGQEKLRDLVQQHPRFMIFASSQALVEGTRSPERPFYEFFKVIHLRRLTVEEAMAFLISIASVLDKKGLGRFLKTAKGRARMRVIYEFTCGNHRLLVTFYQLLTTESVVKLSELFMQALGPLKPYYQEQMRSLSAQQQKIVQYLSLRRGPCTVKDIARGCLAAPNTISSQLKGLLTRNFVNKVDKIEDGRESHYEVTEALFRICYEADLEQKGAPVRLFVDFLANYYTGQEVLIRRRGYELLARKLGNGGNVPFADEAELYRKASLYHPQAAGGISQEGRVEYEGPGGIRTFFAEMEKSKAYREIVEFSRHLGKEKDAFVLHAEASAYAHLDEPEKAKAVALEALEKDPNDVEAHLVLADVLGSEPEGTEEALKHAHRARELAPKEPRALACIGIVYGIAGDYGGALRNFELLNREHPDYSRGWSLTGQALHYLERTEEAEVASRKVLELDPRNALGLEWVGRFAGNAGGHEEALGLFRRLNEVEPEYAEGWALTGLAFAYLEQTGEAEADYRKALELDPQQGAALDWFGRLCYNAGRCEEALGLFERLNRVEPEYAEGWALAGQVLQNLKRTEEAEAAYRKALELDPRQRMALDWFGRLCYNAGRYEEAMGLSRRLNKVEPDFAVGWVLTGAALHNLRRTEEAEAAFRKGMELDPRNTRALEWLGWLLGNSGRHEEALEFFQRLNKVAPEYGNGWRGTAVELEYLGREGEAAEAFEEAIRLGADRVWLLTARGEVRRERGKYAAAIADYEEALGCDAKAVWPQFNIVSSELALGDIEAALERLAKALEADKASEEPAGPILVESLQENCEALFVHGPIGRFREYLEGALGIIEEAGYLEQMEQSIALTVFGFLKGHEGIDEQRFAAVVRAFEEVVGRRIDVRMAVHFLQVGIDYFKKKDRRALLRLTREERETFCKEVGIKDPGGES